MKRTILAVVLLVAATAACRQAPSVSPTDRPRSTSTHSPTPTPTWDGPGSLGEDASVDVASFNAYVDEVDASWTQSPLRMALEFLALSDPSNPDGGAFRTIAEQQASPEGGTEAMVVVTQEGLHDDSVQAIRFTLEFEKQGDGWVLVTASWGQRCHQGRGHQEFTPEFCV